MLSILFYKFFKIGLFSFGGGYAMLPLFKHEFVETGMITYDEFMEIMTISEMTPGSFGINAATFIGKAKGGLLGAIISTFAVALPSLIILLILLKLLSRHQESPLKDRIFRGLRPAVLGFIFSALMVLMPSTFINTASVLLYILSMGLLFSKKIHPILVIFLMGALGLLL